MKKSKKFEIRNSGAKLCPTQKVVPNSTETNESIVCMVPRKPIERRALPPPRKCKRNYFPSKRGHYRSYRKADWLWVDVFKKIEQFSQKNTYGEVTSVAEEYGIAQQTLCRRYHKWVELGRPLSIEDSSNNDVRAALGAENRGGHNQLFTIAQEYEVARWIETEFLDKKIALVDEDLALILQQWYDDFNPHSTRSKSDATFFGSHHFVTDFKERHRFSSRMPNMSHHAAPNPELNAQMQTFQRKMAERIRTLGADHVGNSDETAVYRVGKIVTCIGKKGADSVLIEAGANDKECLTFTATILADGSKLDTMVCKVGTTERTFKNLHLPSGTLTHFNQSGWSDLEMMKKIIDHFSAKTGATKKHTSALGLDCYHTHYSPEIKKHAASKNVILEIMPPGATRTLQPLDVAVFGPVKASMRRKWRLERIRTRGGVFEWKTTVKHFFKSYSSMQKRTISGSFRKAGWFAENV